MINYESWRLPAEGGQWWLSTPFAMGLGVVMLALILWSLVWKGLSLWKAARHGHKWWFVVLLVVNTAGILDILYIYVFSKKKIEDIMKPANPVN